MDYYIELMFCTAETDPNTTKEKVTLMTVAETALFRYVPESYHLHLKQQMWGR